MSEATPTEQCNESAEYSPTQIGSFLAALAIVETPGTAQILRQAVRLIDAGEKRADRDLADMAIRESLAEFCSWRIAGALGHEDGIGQRNTEQLLERLLLEAIAEWAR